LKGLEGGRREVGKGEEREEVEEVKKRETCLIN
jgi:hypothetical protein